MSSNLELFRDKKIKAKKIFDIVEISKNVALDFVSKYHYLKNAKFFSCYNYGLILKDTKEMVGVATFSNPQGNVTLKSWFNLPNSDKTILELSRLAMLPELNGTNATSFLLGNSMKMLSKNGIRGVITLADSSRHVGSIYQVCNFAYYGLTADKNDFYREEKGIVAQRGKTNGVLGCWVKRSRKHRYAYIMDKNLKCNYERVYTLPKKDDIILNNCCNGTGKVFDKRNKIWYTCPKCTGKFERIDNV